MFIDINQYTFITEVFFFLLKMPFTFISIFKGAPLTGKELLFEVKRVLDLKKKQNLQTIYLVRHGFKAF
jgi:hypothetical protein